MCLCACCRKYAAPYEVYWKPKEERTPPLKEDEAPPASDSDEAADTDSHHVKHGTKHHKHHGIAHHTASNLPAAPASPAANYQKYYSQYMPGGVQTSATPASKHHASAADATSLPESDALPAPAETESLSEASSSPSPYMDQYMNAGDSYSAQPEIDASQQLSGDMQSEYKQLYSQSVTSAGSQASSAHCH